MEWVKRYLGKRFLDKGRGPDSFDCYGLVWHIQKHIFGNDIPKLDESYEHIEDVSIPELCKEEAKNWSPVIQGEEREGDVILLLAQGEPWHVGVVLEKGKMVHISKGVGVCVESYLRKNWIRRIEGIYRWERV